MGSSSLIDSEMPALFSSWGLQTWGDHFLISTKLVQTSTSYPQPLFLSGARHPSLLLGVNPFPARTRRPSRKMTSIDLAQNALSARHAITFSVSSLAQHFFSNFWRKISAAGFETRIGVPPASSRTHARTRTPLIGKKIVIEQHDSWPQRSCE